MMGQVQLDGLLLTRDKNVIAVMNQILGSFSIDTEVCDEIDSALDAVAHRRLDAVIVDWDVVTDPTRLVRAARKSSANSNSTIVAMVNEGSETHALLVGANFMILKPADLDHANRCMRAAYGTMLQNRRRAARVPVDLPGIVRVVDVGNINARISDLSIGGLALQCQQSLQVNQEVLAQFLLPGTADVVHIAGKVVNASPAGRAGVRFSLVSDSDVNLLENWLAVELAKLEKVEMPDRNAFQYSN